MRFSRKRKFDGPTKSVMVRVSLENYQKLDKIAGHDSLGRTIETLIEQEYKRKRSNAIQSCTENGAVRYSA